MIEFKNEIGIKKNTNRVIYICIGVFFAVLIIVLVAMFLLKYHVEGEKKLPFEITEMLIISTADGIGEDNEGNRWNISILQNNDIYINIKEKISKEKPDSLKKIILQNFNINNGPEKGEPKIYHPTDDKDLIYLYKEENQILDKAEYNVATSSNVKKMQISKEGGIVSFSSCSTNIARYISNEDTQIKYDGSLLNKVNITEEQIQYTITFDIIVEMESGKKYKGSITLELPLKDLITDGTVKKEIKSFDNIVFKRE